ncbi:hypothetical protein [Polyangium fumosum]|uniref:Uncharacterized protein n=1 Tax=Polyangium fumosum TaxID=889272 RepID=A0A4V6WQM0_9BACT|nr:hypothetical protein [Polyangium fumosum]TKD00120.1 hypothetical protein E8A74_35795 [Polyangium fumosum]
MGRLGAVVLAALVVLGVGCGNDARGDQDGCAPSCPTLCTPSSKTCKGTVAETCAADGQSRESVDCATEGLVCAEGACLPSEPCGDGACLPSEPCGDGACSDGETFASCPEDCEPVCEPNTKMCEGNVAKVCAADGGSWMTFDCTLAILVCHEGSCFGSSVCGDGACIGPETPASCPDDCPGP